MVLVLIEGCLMNECDWMDHFRKLLDGFGIPDTTLECSSQGWPEDVVGCVEVKDVKVRYSIGLNSIMFSDARARKHFLYELVCRYGDKAEFLEEEELPRFVFFHVASPVGYGSPMRSILPKRRAGRQHFVERVR